jgi:hypothetical protein
VADMNRTVRIWERTGHKRSVEFLFHYIVFLTFFVLRSLDFARDDMGVTRDDIIHGQVRC